MGNWGSGGRGAVAGALLLGWALTTPGCGAAFEVESGGADAAADQGGDVASGQGGSDGTPGADGTAPQPDATVDGWDGTGDDAATSGDGTGGAHSPVSDSGPSDGAASGDSGDGGSLDSGGSDVGTSDSGAGDGATGSDSGEDGWAGTDGGGSRDASQDAGSTMDASDACIPVDPCTQCGVVATDNCGRSGMCVCSAGEECVSGACCTPTGCSTTTNCLDTCGVQDPACCDAGTPPVDAGRDSGQASDSGSCLANGWACTASAQCCIGYCDKNGSGPGICSATACLNAGQVATFGCGFVLTEACCYGLVCVSSTSKCEP